jgi:hypothetical protein
VLLALLASDPDRLPPVDQCGAGAQFAAFRAALLETIERRDSAAVLAVVADDIEVDFGGGAGRHFFAGAWRLDRPDESELRRGPGEALNLGCTLTHGRAAAPSMVGTMPPGPRSLLQRGRDRRRLGDRPRPYFRPFPHGRQLPRGDGPRADGHP